MLFFWRSSEVYRTSEDILSMIQNTHWMFQINNPGPLMLIWDFTHLSVPFPSCPQRRTLLDPGHSQPFFVWSKLMLMICALSPQFRHSMHEELFETPSKGKIPSFPFLSSYSLRSDRKAVTWIHIWLSLLITEWLAASWQWIERKLHSLRGVFVYSWWLLAREKDDSQAEAFWSLYFATTLQTIWLK